MYKCLRENNFSFLWDKCPGVKLVDHMVSQFLFLKGTATFSEQLGHFKFSCMSDPIFPRFHQHLVLPLFCI